jgi:hypothetical protein
LAASVRPARIRSCVQSSLLLPVLPGRQADFSRSRRQAPTRRVDSDSPLPPLHASFPDQPSSQIYLPDHPPSRLISHLQTDFRTVLLLHCQLTSRLATPSLSSLRYLILLRVSTVVAVALARTVTSPSRPPPAWRATCTIFRSRTRVGVRRNRLGRGRAEPADRPARRRPPLLVAS